MSSSNGVLLHLQEDSGDSDRAYDSSVHSGAAYYHPISSLAPDSVNDVDNKPSSEESNGAGSNTAHPFQQNGFFHPSYAEYDIAALDLQGVAANAGVRVESGWEEEEEEEEEMVRETEVSISRRAFREDESRRNAPLLPETAARVVEAMRAVSFHGEPPEWTERVPEDQWVHWLRSLRGEPTGAQS